MSLSRILERASALLCVAIAIVILRYYPLDTITTPVEYSKSSVVLPAELCLCLIIVLLRNDHGEEKFVKDSFTIY